MGAKRFLLLGVGLLILAWAASGTGVLRRAPALIGYVVAALFVLAAVRVGLSIAIIAFDLSPVSIAIPIALGVLAWWLRPGRNARF
jgi:hypothetical protein